MRAALIQLNTGNVIEDAITVAEGFIREAVEQGAAFVSTPETTHLMEMNRTLVLEKTFPEDQDPGVKRFRALAAELGIWLHIGSLIIKVADNRLANRSFLFSPEGEMIATYDKMHLFDVDLGGGETYRESALYDAGDEALVVNTPIGNLGLSICYDLRFPYLYRALAHAGANILLIPAAFTKPTGEAHWHTLLRARAIETGCYVLAAAQTGLHATGRETFGHSLVVDPWGEIIADAGTATGPLLFDLDLAKCAEARQKIPSLMHDRDVKVTSKEVP